MTVSAIMSRLAGVIIISAVLAVIAVIGFQEILSWHHKDMADIERLEKINSK